MGVSARSHTTASHTTPQPRTCQDAQRVAQGSADARRNLRPVCCLTHCCCRDSCHNAAWRLLLLLLGLDALPVRCHCFQRVSGCCAADGARLARCCW
jgi:hypothetical protein